MLAVKNGDPERLVCTECGFVLYLDPKVAVGTIITTGDARLVLVRRAIEPGYGLWVFPGGYVDRGEEITAAAIREAREEAGLDVRLEGLVNIYSYPGRPLIIVVYAATAISRAAGVAGSSRPKKLAENATDPVRRSVMVVATRSGRIVNRSWYPPLTSKNGET